MQAGSTLQAAKVRELAFSDLYLGHPLLTDRFSDVPGAAVNPVPAGAALKEDLARLTAACVAECDKAPESGEYKIAHDGVAYRVCTMRAQGGHVFVVRRIAEAVSSMAELGIPQAYLRRLLAPGLAGLFIVSGAVKSGKTMTACALLKDRLATHGGIAVTAENPVELPLEGSHGHGICFQTVLQQEQGLAEALRKMMRWRAGTLLIGEIHDAESAAELLKASVNGHLVVTTMLADDVAQTVLRLAALAEERLGAANARALLSEGLLGVLHQRMAHGARTALRLETEFLFMKDAPVLRSALRKGEFDTLGVEIARQRASLIAGQASSPRLA